MSGPDPVLAPLAAEKGAWAVEHLASDVVGWLTTVAPDGRVQTSVISFFWDGRTILLYSQPDAPKVRNIAANPQVSFALNTDPFGDNLLIVEGTAVVDEDTPAWASNEPFAVKFREPLAHWGLDEAETSRSFSAAIRITPTRIRVL
jgi:PPOX class probable F420-dependent enzyme